MSIKLPLWPTDRAARLARLDVYRAILAGFQATPGCEVGADRWGAIVAEAERRVAHAAVRIERPAAHAAPTLGVLSWREIAMDADPMPHWVSEEAARHEWALMVGSA